MSYSRHHKKYFLFRQLLLLFTLISLGSAAYTQVPGIIKRIPRENSPSGNRGNPNQKGKAGKDTLGFQHRNDLEDSITISYRYLDSLKSQNIDSSVSDFNEQYSVPGNYVTLGNNGNPAFPVLFTPLLNAGWDAGFHALDLYKYKLEDTKFYKTTRPFTQLTYLLGNGKEQVIKVLQTQNIKPNWNAGIEYRLISSPGVFQSQNSNHNNYRFFSNYQGPKKRYAAYMVLLGNKLAVSENGGIKNDSFLLDPNMKKRFSVPVNLGGSVELSYTVFSTKVNTGLEYSNFNAFFRQSYDFGIKDSIIINDSTTDYLFYPKFRFQHTINYRSSTNRFKDTLKNIAYAEGDSAIFNDWYNLQLDPSHGLNFWVQDKWKFVSNDFSIKQFPETKNPAQFIEAGLRVENFTGIFSSSPDSLKPETKKNYYNIVLHGEYRNKTRNKKWDALLKGEFFATGLNAGDYSAYATLTRLLNARLGDVQVTFQNVNRSPSYIFEGNSAFNFNNSLSTKKENLTVITASANNPKFSLMARNISITNYTYFKNYYQADQFNGLVNITQIAASTKNKVVGRLNLYSDFIIQQTTGDNPVRVPLFFTRQRLAFEGVFFRNLNLSTGIDVRYNTPYKANNYSPVMGHFFPQDSVTIKNLPEVGAFFNFRIKSFMAFIKADNLNTISFADGFGFTNNGFAAPNYPTPGYILRFGIVWRFVN
ncbi:MAG: putative porin [Ginsengibacter sp.]